MCSMLILLDEDGSVVAALDIDAPADSVLVNELGEFVFEDVSGEDRVYRRREWASG